MTVHPNFELIANITQTVAQQFCAKIEWERDYSGETAIAHDGRINGILVAVVHEYLDSDEEPDGTVGSMFNTSEGAESEPLFASVADAKIFFERMAAGALAELNTDASDEIYKLESEISDQW